MAAADQASELEAAQQQLQDLQKLLEHSTRSITDPVAAADAHLSHLRRAAAALQAGKQRLDLSQAARLPETVRACSAAVGCLQSQAAALLQPPAELYSGLSGAPTQPAEGLVLAGVLEAAACCFQSVAEGWCCPVGCVGVCAAQLQVKQHTQPGRAAA